MTGFNNLIFTEEIKKLLTGCKGFIVPKNRPQLMDLALGTPGATTFDVDYRIDGKLTDAIPADMRGFEQIEPVYTKLKGWKTSTEGITEFDKLPKEAQEYLHFLEKESGAKIGMVSTGPDREQTITMSGFEAALGA